MHTICSSRVSQVCVYARGAWVTRTLTLPHDLTEAEEEVELVVPDVTPLADAGSVRAVVRAAGRRVVSVQTALAVPETQATPGETAARVREIGRGLERLQSERDRQSGHRQALVELDPEPRLRLAARRPEETEGVAARVADGLATAALVGDVLAELDARIGVLDEAIRKQVEELEAARLADAQASSRARMGSGHPTRRVHIRLAGSGPVDGAEIAYVVPAARWWPVYTVRFADGGKRSSWIHDAIVAQLSGEDWTGVALALSTADLIADARLPELTARKLGRAQPAVRRGYRAPPEGLERLFAGWDRAFSGMTPPPVSAPQVEAEEIAAFDSFAGETEEEVTRPGVADRPQMKKARARTERSFAGPPLPAPMAQMAEPVMARAMPGSLARLVGGRIDGAPLAAAPPPEEPEARQPPDPGEAWLDFDALTLAPAEDAVHRGRLVRGGGGPTAAQARQAAQLLDAREPPGAVVDVLGSRGRFDHRYDAAGASDVPSDGAAHRVSIGSAEAAPALRYRTVPREAASVYKEAEIKNPFAAPLLAGPVDVYVEGSLLLTTGVSLIDRGGTMTLGLGVEERIRVARNVRFDEASAGILGGQTVVDSYVAIDLASALAVKVTVEVLERIPVTDDKSLEIAIPAATPDTLEYTQAERGVPIRGGRRFVVELPAGGKADVRYQLRVAFAAKSEIAGGNRRD